MPKGGARPGAGRPKGSTTRKSAPVTAELVDKLVTDGGKLPLSYMLEVMRDENATATRRDEMARAAAPYLHPRLANVELTGANRGAIQTENSTISSAIEGLSQEERDLLRQLAVARLKRMQEAEAEEEEGDGA